MDAQLDEELVHLTNIGGIAVGVKDGGLGVGMPNVDSDDLRAAAVGEAENLDVLAVRERVHEQQPRGLLLDEPVRRRTRREERQLRRH